MCPHDQQQYLDREPCLNERMVAPLRQLSRYESQLAAATEKRKHSPNSNRLPRWLPVDPALLGEHPPLGLLKSHQM